MKQNSQKRNNIIIHEDRPDDIRLNKYISESGIVQDEKLIN